MSGRIGVDGRLVQQLHPVQHRQRTAATPQEIASAVVFLLSELASYKTGQGCLWMAGTRTWIGR